MDYLSIRTRDILSAVMSTPSDPMYSMHITSNKMHVQNFHWKQSQQYLLIPFPPRESLSNRVNRESLYDINLSCALLWDEKIGDGMR